MSSDSSLFGLPVGHTSAWFSNCYVLHSDSALALVDPGLPVVAEQALELIRTDLERQPAEIGAVMCTHGHHDHLAGVSTVTEHAQPDIRLPAQCEAYLGGERPRTFPVVESFMRFLPVLADQPFAFRAAREFATLGRKVGYGGRPDLVLDFEPSGFLGDGDPMPTMPGWEAIHAPGHADDATCLYHADSATLISGDTVCTQDGTAWFNPEYVDLAVAKETEERLRSLEVRHLLPGHGRPIAAADVWATARSSTDRPTGSGLLARCSRRFGRWPD